jgi:mono/diheme cytochrome c family protein
MGLLAGVLLWSVPAWVQELPALKSANVELPNDDKQFPGGAEADAINNNCLACHSADMVLNQPSFPKATWEAEVRKMITVYRAPIDDSDAAKIVAYLAQTKGTK